MTTSGILSAIIIGGIAGWLASQIMKGSSLSLFACIGVGIVGSFVGSFLLGLLGLHASGIIGSIIAATVGAMVLLFVVGKLKA